MKIIGKVNGATGKVKLVKVDRGSKAYAVISIDVRDGFREVITEVHELKPLKEQDSDEAFNYDYYYVVVGCEIYLENFDDWKSEEHIYTMYYAVKRS